jgi:hypothetical protein
MTQSAEIQSVESCDRPSRFPTFAWLISIILPQTLPSRVFFQTKTTLRGMPLICVADEAYGVIAIGRKAFGIFAFGVYATGCFAFGVLAIGLFSLGVGSLGFFAAFGSLAISTGYAFGVTAIGTVALGVGTFGVIETSFFYDGLFFHWDKPVLKFEDSILGGLHPRLFLSFVP